MSLFESFNLGQVPLINRVVMSPMTRARNADGIPCERNALYYSQRAGKNGAGLIITEGLSISSTASGVLFIPGIFNQAQVDGWKITTNAVHNKNSLIYAQLWHVGRVAHLTNHPEHKHPVSASDIVAKNTFAYAYNANGNPDFIPASKPKKLNESEIEEIIEDYVTAAKNAISAGFDGIEIHAGNGYLIEQFFNPTVNTREDKFGGSIANRSRFLLNIVDKISNAIGSNHIGVRLSPFNYLNGMSLYPEIEETYLYLASELSQRNLSYVHFINLKNADDLDVLTPSFLKKFRSIYDGIILMAGGMTLDKATDLIANNTIDLAVFGQAFIANPDLTNRLKNNWPLEIPDRTSFYGGDEKGYTDYNVYKE